MEEKDRFRDPDESESPCPKNSRDKTSGSNGLVRHSFDNKQLKKEECFLTNSLAVDEAPMAMMMVRPPVIIIVESKTKNTIIRWLTNW